MTEKRTTTDDGRVILTQHREEPSLARKNKRMYQLWKLIEKLELQDLEALISFRRESIKYSESQEEIKLLRTEIVLLEDAYKIKNRKKGGNIWQKLSAMKC
jgi:hypothetical protein